MHKGLDGKVALITGGGRAIGRSIALALAARGVRIVVTGPATEERFLGETVGEIAYGGGKARHVVGNVQELAHVGLAVDRAVEVFGGLDIVIADDALGAATLAVAPRMRDHGRFVAIGESSAGAPSETSEAVLRGLVTTAADELAERQIACNAVLVGAGRSRRVEPEEVAELVVFLCSTAAAAISGQAITIGCPRPRGAG